MFNIFLALFGGIFYGSQYICDKRSRDAAMKQTEEVSKNHINNLNQWKSRVVDIHLEMELRHLVNTSSFSEIKKSLTSIGWKGKISDITKAERDNTVRLLMASKGKLLRIDAELGIPSKFLDLPENYLQAQGNLESYDMVMFIDRWLQKYGIREQMYIERPGVYNPLNENSAHTGGRYVWQPMLPLYPNIVEVPSYVRVSRTPRYNSIPEALSGKNHETLEKIFKKKAQTFNEGDRFLLDVPGIKAHSNYKQKSPEYRCFVESNVDTVFYAHINGNNRISPRTAPQWIFRSEDLIKI